MSWKRLAVALITAAVLTGLISTVAAAQWPTTCVDLNDIVEGHLGNQGNVGIYQSTFGDQAEAACQNDHREDVRSTFAWALGLARSNAAYQQGSIHGDRGWTYDQFGRLSVARYHNHSDISGDFMATCDTSKGDGSASLVFPQDRFLFVASGDVVVTHPLLEEYRAEYWQSNGQDIVLTTNAIPPIMAIILNREMPLSFRAVDSLGYTYYVYADTTGTTSPDHPLRRLLADCGVQFGWPTSCVQLNDIVENYLGNLGNVRIYQRAFADQAEQACQNDHRNDVRSVFAWAIG